MAFCFAVLDILDFLTGRDQTCSAAVICLNLSPHSLTPLSFQQAESRYTSIQSSFQETHRESYKRLLCKKRTGQRVKSSIIFSLTCRKWREVSNLNWRRCLEKRSPSEPSSPQEHTLDRLIPRPTLALLIWLSWTSGRASFWKNHYPGSVGCPQCKDGGLSVASTRGQYTFSLHSLLRQSCSAPVMWTEASRYGSFRI